MKGKVCVITGATSGIGRATALALGTMGADLVLLGRNSGGGNRLVERLRRDPGGGTAEFLPTDLSIQSQVREATRRIAERYSHLDVLINNAGARFDRHQHSADGLELTFATNHLSHFLLTQLLLDPLRRASMGRIITVTSGAHGAASADGEWQLGQGNYDRRQAYAKSKLANLMFAYSLSERLQGTGVTSNAVDPGGVASNFARNNGFLSWARHLLAHGLRRELVLPRQGAETIVYLASSTEARGVSGKLFRNKQEVRSSSYSYDPQAAEALWKLSLSLTGLGGLAGTFGSRMEQVRSRGSDAMSTLTEIRAWQNLVGATNLDPEPVGRANAQETHQQIHEQTRRGILGGDGGGRWFSLVIRRLRNGLLGRMAMFAPGGYSIRPMLHRWRGVQLGRRVWVSQWVYLDELYPQAITIGDNCTLGLRTSVIAHIHWGPRRATGGFKPVVIEANVFIGPHCVVLPGIRIGEGAVIRAGSVVARNIPPRVFWGASAERPLARVTVPLTPDSSYEEFSRGLKPLGTDPSASSGL